MTCTVATNPLLELNMLGALVPCRPLALTGVASAMVLVKRKAREAQATRAAALRAHGRPCERPGPSARCTKFHPARPGRRGPPRVATNSHYKTSVNTIQRTLGDSTDWTPDHDHALIRVAESTARY